MDRDETMNWKGLREGSETSIGSYNIIVEEEEEEEEQVQKHVKQCNNQLYHVIM